MFLVELAHLCSLVHQPLDIFEILHCAFRQVFDVRAEGRVFPDFERAFVVVGRVQQVADLCARTEEQFGKRESAPVVAKGSTRSTRDEKASLHALSW